MNTIPQKIAARISDGLKKFQPIITANKAKDVNESDTVTLIIDMLSEILGFDKYNDITTEHNVRGQYCDIALRIKREKQSANRQELTPSPTTTDVQGN